MNRILRTTIAAAVLAIPAALSAADYTVFRVCEDQHVLRTSDGAEAGRVEYIVIEPTSQRVVSAVVTGGVVAEKYVAVPMTALRFGGDRQVTLTNITRERLVAAPVFETTRFKTTSVIEPAFVERSYTHFGLDAAEITRARTSTTVGGAIDRRNSDTTISTETERANPRDASTGTAADRERMRANREAAAGRAATSTDASATSTDANARPDANKRDASSATDAKADRKNTKAADKDAPRSGTDADTTRPGRSSNAPGQTDVAPGRNQSTPGQSDSTPAKTGTTAPGQSGTTPGQSGTTPGQSGTTPGAREHSDDAPAKGNSGAAKKADETKSAQPKADRSTSGAENKTGGADRPTDSGASKKDRE